jgi:hypothetical protein
VVQATSLDFRTSEFETKGTQKKNVPFNMSHRVLSSDVQNKLSELKLLLAHLPAELPSPPAQATKYPFLDFQLDPVFLERTESEVGAINESFKAIFGWDARTTGDGIISILERGNNICAVADVLTKYLTLHPRDGILEKWLIDIIAGVKKVYNETQKEVGLVLTIDLLLRELSQLPKSAMHVGSKSESITL